MSGSFWKFSNGFTSLSNIGSILEKYDSTESTDEERLKVLLKVLDENDLLQELLSNNSTLLEFLREEKVLDKLVDLITTEGATDDTCSKNEEGLPEGKNEGAEVSKIDDSSKKNAGVERNSSDDTSDLSEKDSFDNSKENDDIEETAQERQIRHATLAAEILSADVWSLTDTLMDSTTHLNRLWSVLDNEEPLSINLSTYFMKIMEHLLDMKCDEMVTYLIENQPNLVRKFMNHLSNPPFIDFLLKLISTDKPDNSTGIIDYLQRQNFITELINALDLDAEGVSDSEFYLLLVKQSSAADFLKALITISANSTSDNSNIGPNELTRELVSEPQMERLCDLMLKGGYNLSNGVGIIIEIIRKNNSDYDILPVLYITLESHPPTGRDPIYLGHLLKVFGSKITQFNQLLNQEAHINNKKTSALKTPFGEIEPLGFERFKICELIAELLHCSNMALLNDNKGFEVVKERDEVRNKMKNFDPLSFKYNEVIVLPRDKDEANSKESQILHSENEAEDDTDEICNDTIDSFNSKLHDDTNSFIHNLNDNDGEEEPHANSNLTEEQMRQAPVVGDYLKIALYDTQIITHITNMFYKFPWNNFLHNVVFDIVQQILNGSMDIGFNKFLAVDLFSNADITSRIVKGQDDCTIYEKENNGLRLGYMGHLTLIAEEVVKFIQLYPSDTLSEVINTKIQDKAWEAYVNEILYDTREKYNAILGGTDDDETDDVTHTFDENNDDIVGNEGYNDLNLNPEIDQDIIGNFEQQSKSDSDEEEPENSLEKQLMKSSKSNSSDDSSEEDDDYFTNYMSQQLTNSASTEVIPSETERISDSIQNMDIKENEFSSNDKHIELDDNNDDYIDPNDDGLSYCKPSSIYDSNGSLINISNSNEEDVSSESSSSSESEEDEEYVDENYEKANNNEYKRNELTRAESKS